MYVVVGCGGCLDEMTYGLFRAGNTLPICADEGHVLNWF